MTQHGKHTQGARFSGKVAVVTGGASGAGLAVAKRLAGEGASVALWDRDEATVTEAASGINGALALCVDVTDHQAVANASAETFDNLGKLDLLLLSASITGATGLVAEYAIYTWRPVNAVTRNSV